MYKKTKLHFLPNINNLVISEICSGANVIVEKMESSGMSFTERVLKLTENDYDIKKEIAPISFNEINSLLKIEESKNIGDVLMQSG